MKRVYIIAEVGVNHNGDFKLAKKYVQELAKLDIDAIKFQKAVPELSYANEAFKVKYQKENTPANKSPLEMCRSYQLTEDEHKKLYKLCNDYNKDYLCSPFEIESLKFLDNNFDLKYMKIPSGELVNIEILEYCSKIDTPIILSTGMASIEEIKNAIIILKKHKDKEIILLHCISQYPCPVENVNLNFMKVLHEEIGLQVGFSDHTLGKETALAAVGMGAKVIEKHVTLDRNLPGPDHKASATIKEFIDYVKALRTAEKCLGNGIRTFSEVELEIKSFARKSIVAKKNLKPGHIISREDIIFKRPGLGFMPYELDKVIGKKVVNEIAENSVIFEKDII